MKKLTLLLSAVILSACIEKNEEKKAEASVPAGFKIGASISSDIETAYFDRVSNGALRQFMKDHPDWKIDLQIADDDFEKQKEQIQAMINSSVQGILLHIGNADADQQREIVNMVCASKIPAVYHNVMPSEKLLSACPNAYYVGTDDAAAGVQQGLTILKAWRENPSWDKNGDGVIQYARVRTFRGNTSGATRSTWSNNTISFYPELGVGVEELFDGYTDFDPEKAKALAEKWASDPKFADVEVLISNSDSSTENMMGVFNSKGIKLPTFSMEGSDWAKKAVADKIINDSVQIQFGEEVKVALQLLANVALEKPISENIPYLIEDRKIRIPPKQ